MFAIAAAYRRATLIPAAVSSAMSDQVLWTCFTISLKRSTLVFSYPQAGRPITPSYGTSVWTGRALQAESDDLEVIRLALLYPALERNVCVPGHHGYPRASDLILGKAHRGRSCHQIMDATARPFLHLKAD
jgi:hypothetical protein